MTLDAASAALVLVDYQQRLLPAIHGAESAIRHAVFLANVAQAVGIPVVGTEQDPQSLGANDDRIRTRCGATIAKRHFDACRDGLLRALAPDGRDLQEVVIAGCESHVCLAQTAMGLLGAGLRVAIVPAACGSRRPEDHALAMQRLAQAGATLLGHESVAFEWLRTSEHPAFRQVLALVKGFGLAQDFPRA